MLAIRRRGLRVVPPSSTPSNEGYPPVVMTLVVHDHSHWHSHLNGQNRISNNCASTLEVAFGIRLRRCKPGRRGVKTKIASRPADKFSYTDYRGRTLRKLDDETHSPSRLRPVSWHSFLARSFCFGST